LIRGSPESCPQDRVEDERFYPVVPYASGDISFEHNRRLTG
jgi:hypothetical protein